MFLSTGNRRGRLPDMRIGYVKTEFDQQTDPERKTIYQQALDALKSAGANLQADRVAEVCRDLVANHSGCGSGNGV